MLGTVLGQGGGDKGRLPSATYPNLQQFQGKAFNGQLDDFHHARQALPSLGWRGRRVASRSPPP